MSAFWLFQKYRTRESETSLGFSIADIRQPRLSFLVQGLAQKLVNNRGSADCVLELKMTCALVSHLFVIHDHCVLFGAACHGHIRAGVFVSTELLLARRFTDMHIDIPVAITAEADAV